MTSKPHSKTSDIEAGLTVKDQSVPFISVVICSYNRRRLLERAIQSLCRQVERDFEAIVVDDGSTDSTKSFVGLLSKQYSWLKLKVHGRNMGVSSARNTGVSHARGKYVTFLDSDDTYSNHHLRDRKTKLLLNPEIEFLHGGVRVVGDPYVVDKNAPNRLIHIEKCALGGTFFIRRDIFDKIGLFRDLVYAEDAEFLERAIDAGVLIERETGPSYIYYRNVPNQLTSRYSKSRTLVTKLASWLDHHGANQLNWLMSALRRNHSHIGS